MMGSGAMGLNLMDLSISGGPEFTAHEMGKMLKELDGTIAPKAVDMASDPWVRANRPDLVDAADDYLELIDRLAEDIAELERIVRLIDLMHGSRQLMELAIAKRRRFRWRTRSPTWTTM